MSEELEIRLDRFARRLAALEEELVELRRLARAPRAPVALPAPPPAPPRRVPELPPRVPPAPARAPVSARVGEALGARALAWTGGAVTLLGVVLLFALAVNRGWIGPWERCAIGFAASATVFAGGLWLRSRYGMTHSALAAVGAGIGGAYASLLAAAALYELLPAWAALGVAGAIASVGVVTAIVWSAEVVAGVGLIGAMLVPIAVVFDGGLTVLGTSFVAVVLAAAGIVALWRRWRGLLAAAVGGSLPQVAVLVAMAEPGSAKIAVLAGIFGLLYLGLAVAEQLRGAAGLQALSASLAVLAAVFAGGSSVHLFGGADESVALLAIGGVYLTVGGAFLALRRERDLSSLLWAVGLAIGAVGLADLVSGDVLAIAWSAEAAVLGWLAVRTQERRFQLGALAYLVLATGHALTVDAPLEHLFVARSHPAAGAISVVATVLAAAIVAFYARSGAEERPALGILRHLDPFLAALRSSQPALREALLWAAALLATYAASLGILELAAVAGGHSTGAFDWGQLPVSVLWALLAAGLLVSGARREWAHLLYGGSVWLGVTLAKSFLFDLGSVSNPAGFYAALGVGVLVLTGGYLFGRERDLTAVSVACALSSAALLVIAAVGLLGGYVEGLALLATGACYALLAASVFRFRRDLGTLLWATGLAIVLGAWPELVSGTPLVVAWAATGAGLAWLGRWTSDDRLRLGSAAAIVPALVLALVAEAPPSDLFVARADPGDGAPALAAVALAGAVFALCARSVPEREMPKEAWPWLFWELDGMARRTAAWVAGILAVEAVSLGIVQLFEWGGSGSVHLEFQHGHTAVSALWGLLGLTALYVGLARRSRRLRLAGFAIFGVSLAKIFLYDLSALSSITRALSFLAVGAVLLLGGFFYQRLSAHDDRHPAPG